MAWYVWLAGRLYLATLSSMWTVLMADLVVIGSLLAGTTALDTETVFYRLGDRKAVGQGGDFSHHTVDANVIWLASNVGSNYALARLMEETQSGLVLCMELYCNIKASVWRCFDEMNDHIAQMHRYSQTSLK